VPLQGSPQPIDAVACHGPFAAVTRPASDPPFSGTSFIDPNMLTDADPSSLVSLTYTGVSAAHDVRPPHQHASTR
jgi:hypothetical protein